MAESLRLEPLTAQAFEPFGRVLQTAGQDGLSINHGLTRKFAALANPELGGPGQADVSIYRSQPIALPFRLREMERHVGLSQAFMPLQDRAFPLVVALGDGQPHGLRAFLATGRQGVCLHPGTWHHHQLSLEVDCDYLVLESRGNESATEVFSLEQEVWLQA